MVKEHQIEIFFFYKRFLLLQDVCVFSYLGFTFLSAQNQIQMHTDLLGPFNPSWLSFFCALIFFFSHCRLAVS